MPSPSPPPLFGLGYISIWEINMDVFSIYWIALPVLSCLCNSFIFLFLLSNISYPPCPCLGICEPCGGWTLTDAAPRCGYDITSLMASLCFVKKIKKSQKQTTAWSCHLASALCLSPSWFSLCSPTWLLLSFETLQIQRGRLR